MTTEEKAKAYDRAVEIINGTSTDKYGCIIGIKPTDIFPKLAESEDEKIRIRLITLVNDTFDDNNFGYLTKREDYNNMIAWLEKQGEQKSVEWSKEMGSLVLDAIGLIRDYGEDVPKDSQLGQKIARADAFLSDLYHESFYPSTFNLRNDLKPMEWSEEDEKNFHLLVEIIEFYETKQGVLYKELKLWLKSLRPQKQLKQLK